MSLKSNKFHQNNYSVQCIYISTDIIRQIKSRRMRSVEHVARMGEGRNVYRVLVGKPEGKRPPESWENGIKMDLR
jgi:hypothetical protein